MPKSLRDRIRDAEAAVTKTREALAKQITANVELGREAAIQKEAAQTARLRVTSVEQRLTEVTGTLINSTKQIRLKQCESASLRTKHGSSAS